MDPDSRCPRNPNWEPKEKYGGEKKKLPGKILGEAWIPGKMPNRIEREDFILWIMRDLIKVNMKNLHNLICMLGGLKWESGFRNLERRSYSWQVLKPVRGDPKMEAFNLLEETYGENGR